MLFLNSCTWIYNYFKIKSLNKKMIIWNFTWISKYKMDLEVKCTVKAVMLPWARKKDHCWASPWEPPYSGRTCHSPDKPLPLGLAGPSLGTKSPPFLSFGSSQGLPTAMKFPPGHFHTPFTHLLFLAPQHCVWRCTDGCRVHRTRIRRLPGSATREWDPPQQ